MTKLIKLMDRIWGPILLQIFPKPRAIPIGLHPAPIKHILVIRPGGMGDALLLLPVLKHLHQSCHVKIDILCEPRNREIFKCCPFIHQIFLYRHPISFLSVFKIRYDAVIDTEQSHFFSAIAARLIQAPIRLGFDTFNRGRLFTHTIEYRQGYEAEVFWQLSTVLFKINKSFSFEFPYLTGSNTNHKLYSEFKKIICLFTGATTRERHWPERRWAKVCDWISRSDKTPVLLGGSSEIQSCRKIMAQCKNEGTVNLSGRLSIAQTVHLFSKAEKLISTDSGILHLAVLCGLPTVSLFGPSDPDKWGPKGKMDKIVHKHVDCSPCASFGTIPTCNNGVFCMLQITENEVIDTLQEFKAGG